MQAEEESPRQHLEDDLSPERRAALVKLGKLAAYMPPAMVILSLNDRAVADPSLGEPPPGP